jgi:hypothetical protein
MFVFRTAVVVGIAIALMPSDPEKQQALIDGAREKTVWVMTYCDREPDNCSKAGDMWSAFLAKAEFAGRLAAEVATYQVDGGEPRVRKVATAEVVNGRIAYSEDVDVETSAQGEN